MSVTIRTGSAGDLGAIKRIAVDTAMFAADEVGVFDEMVDGFWLVADTEGSVVGGAYCAPEPFADRLWNLYFLSVDPRHQADGVGGSLLVEVEMRLRARGGEHARVLVIETSSTDQYAGARRFYRAKGYAEEARIREFYGPGDDKVVFWKSLLE